MKHIRIFFASLVLTCFALSPAAALANDDELDVTMEVIDDLADIDGEVMRMRGPRRTMKSGRNGRSWKQHQEWWFLANHCR